MSTELFLTVLAKRTYIRRLKPAQREDYRSTDLIHCNSLLYRFGHLFRGFSTGQTLSH